jgi:hypothetical protein
MASEEIMQTISRLRGAFEDLAVRGLRSAGPQDLAVLRAVHQEFERIGAGHLAGHIAEVLRAIEADDRGAARALLRAQANLRVFERILTLQVAETALSHLLSHVEEESAS